MDKVIIDYEKRLMSEEKKKKLKPNLEDFDTVPEHSGLSDLSKKIFISDILLEICKRKEGHIEFKYLDEIFESCYEECIITLEDCVKNLEFIVEKIKIQGIKQSFKDVCNDWIERRETLRKNLESIITQEGLNHLKDHAKKNNRKIC